MDILDQIFYWLLLLVFCINLPAAIIAALITGGWGVYALQKELGFLPTGKKTDARMQNIKDNTIQNFINWFLWPRELCRITIRLKNELLPPK